MVGEGCRAGGNGCQAAGKMMGEWQESEERAARGEVARVFRQTRIWDLHEGGASDRRLCSRKLILKGGGGFDVLQRTASFLGCTCAAF
jgi:hypothetical protein